MTPLATAAQPASAADSLARAKSALESTDDATLRGLADQLGEALTVVGDAARELGAYLKELPADASTLETKLARQAELRTLTRKYAADIDGVLQWAANRGSGWRTSMSPKKRWPGCNVVSTNWRPNCLMPQRNSARCVAKRPSGWPRRSPRELSGLAMADAEFTISVTTNAGRLSTIPPR